MKKEYESQHHICIHYENSQYADMFSMFPIHVGHKKNNCISRLKPDGDKYICQVCGEHFTKEDNDNLNQYLKAVNEGKESPYWVQPYVIYEKPSYHLRKLKPMLPAVKFYTNLDGEEVRTVLTEDKWNELNCAGSWIGASRCIGMYID